MKKDYQFKYGNKSVTIAVEENQVLDVINGNEITPLSDIKKALLDALESPIDSPSLSLLASKAGKISFRKSNPPIKDIKNAMPFGRITQLFVLLQSKTKSVWHLFCHALFTL